MRPNVIPWSPKTSESRRTAEKDEWTAEQQSLDSLSSDELTAEQQSLDLLSSDELTAEQQSWLTE
jgi:hypothetical protein